MAAYNTGGLCIRPHDTGDDSCVTCGAGGLDPAVNYDEGDLVCDTCYAARQEKAAEQ